MVAEDGQLYVGDSQSLASHTGSMTGPSSCPFFDQSDLAVWHMVIK